MPISKIVKPEITGPFISDFMTAKPKVVQRTDSLEKVEAVMIECGCRHLPVVEPDGTLVGVVTDRDVALATSVKNAAAQDVLVEEAFVEFPYRARGNELATKVLSDMLSLHIGSALIVDEEESLIGIFTAMDAIKILRTLLEEKSAVPS